MGIFLLLPTSNKHWISSQKMCYLTKLLISANLEEVLTTLQSRNFVDEFRACYYQTEYLHFNTSQFAQTGQL